MIHTRCSSYLKQRFKSVNQRKRDRERAAAYQARKAASAEDQVADPLSSDDTSRMIIYNRATCILNIK